MIPIELLCENYHLGEPLGELEKIKGGFLHQVGKINTTTGPYCIKKLNLNLTAESLQHIQQYQRITQAFQAQGINAIPAITVNNQPYCQINDAIYLVFPWIEGQVLTHASATLDHANNMAKVLAQMHATKIKVEINHAAAWDLKAIAWPDLLADKSEFSAMLPQILTWQQLYDEHHLAFNSDLILSHRDLYPQNVIWQNEQAYIIDWEGTGWIHPQIEVFNLAINWSGFVSDNFDQAIFESVINTYQAVSNIEFTLNAKVIYASFGSWLGWLQCNFLRLAQDKIINQRLVLNEINSCLANLDRLNQFAEQV